MLRFIAPCLLLVLLSFAGCGGDDGTSPGPDTDAPVASGTIDAGGGEIGDADVALTVPAGALDAETDLEIYRESEGRPYGDTGDPVYRLTGLPAQLDAPVTLRLRHDGTKAIDAPTLFFGEERESHEGGRSVSWEMVASRDSTGWVIADLPRGAYDLGDRASREVFLASVDDIAAVSYPGGHFRVVYLETEVTEDRAVDMVQTFDNMYMNLYAANFRFGDQDTIWPLNVYLREPVRDTAAEYILGPWGKGHFNFEPYLADEGVNLTPIVAHEVFHCAQDYYDTRHPSEWLTINPARHWLDEATAAWFESFVSGDPQYAPVGVNLDNYVAPFSGLCGQAASEQGDFGYGMSSLVRRLIETQGTARLHQIFVAFSKHGTAYDTMIEVMDPPLDRWCAQFQRDLVTGDSTPVSGLPGMWWSWSPVGSITGATGDDETLTLRILDFGSDIERISIGGEPPEDDTSLKVKMLDPDAYDLAVFGYHEDDDLPVLLVTGTDSLTVDDWPDVHGSYTDLMVQAVKPRGAEPDGCHLVETDVRLEVVEEQDLSRYEGAGIHLDYHAYWSNGEVPTQGLNLTAVAGIWSGNTYSASWDSTSPSGTHFTGHFDATVDPTDLAVTGWDVASTWEYSPGNYNYYSTSGSGSVPLTYTGDTYLRFNLYEQDVCGAVSSIYVSTVRDDETTREILDHGCNDQSSLTFYLRDDE